MIISDTTIRRFLTERHHDWEHCGGYGEPGYGDADTTLIVFGSYWCRCGHNPHAGTTRYDGKVVEATEMHTFEDHHPRFWHQLETQGVEFEWRDEWLIDHEHDKAYRTQGDSYSWQPSAIVSDYDDILTADTPLEEWISGYLADNPRRCLPHRIYSGHDLEAIGFVKHNGQFESGWHEGQDADPIAIHAAIRRDHPDDTIVFALDYNSQFYSGFSAYHRPNEKDQ